MNACAVYLAPVDSLPGPGQASVTRSGQRRFARASIIWKDN